MKEKKPRKTIPVEELCMPVTVSVPQSWEKKREKLGISRSKAYKRGLKFFFNEVEGSETPDVLRQKLEKLAAQLDYMRKEYENYRKMKGDLVEKR